jgi:hypothetical protein
MVCLGRPRESWSSHGGRSWLPRPQIVGHDQGLRERMQFERFGSAVRRLVDELDRPIETVWFPTGFVSLTVGKRAASSREADCVRVTSGVAQSMAPADSDHDR